MLFFRVLLKSFTSACISPAARTRFHVLVGCGLSTASAPLYNLAIDNMTPDKI